MEIAQVNRWWTVLAGAVGTGLGVGIFIISVLGVLAAPMAEGLGLNRSVVSFAISCFLISTAVGTVSLGILIHRFGVVRPSFVYLVLTVACVALIPAMPSAPIAFYLLFAAMGIAGAAATAFPYTVTIAGLFDHNRGLALALAVVGGGVGGTLAPILANHLHEMYGWRVTFVIVAAIMALPLLGLAFIVRTPPTLAKPPVDRAEQSHWSLYLGKPAFWLIAAALLAIAAGSFILTIIPSMMADRGVTLAAGATIVSISYSASLVARLGVGWLLDRIWAPAVTAVVCLGACCGILLIWQGGDNITLVTIGAALIAMALGAEADLLTYLCSRYFKLDIFSRVVGAMWVVWAWGGSIGTMTSGVAYRQTGSYEPAFLLIAIILAIGAACVLFLGPYTFPPTKRAATSSAA